MGAFVMVRPGGRYPGERGQPDRKLITALKGTWLALMDRARGDVDRSSVKDCPLIHPGIPAAVRQFPFGWRLLEGMDEAARSITPPRRMDGSVRGTHGATSSNAEQCAPLAWRY